VVSMDVSEEMKSLLTVVTDAVDDIVVCSIEESVYSDDIWDGDSTAVEVWSENNCIIVTVKVFIVVVSVVIGVDVGKEDDSVSFGLEVGNVCTNWVSWSVPTIETVDDGNDEDDTVELTTLSVVIDWVVEVVASLIVVSSEDEMVLVSLSILLLLDCK
jgi:hypothetical protein